MQDETVEYSFDKQELSLKLIRCYHSGAIRPYTSSLLHYEQVFTIDVRSRSCTYTSISITVPSLTRLPHPPPPRLTYPRVSVPPLLGPRRNAEESAEPQAQEEEEAPR